MENLTIQIFGKGISRNYTIQFFNSNFQAFTDIGVVSSDTYDYIDRELIEENRDSVFCFRVVASSFFKY